MGGIFQFGPNQEELDRARMLAEANLHVFYRMIDRLEKDELVAFAHILAVAMQHKNRIPQLYGEVTTVLRMKFETCACGEDHMSPDSLLTSAGEQSTEQ